MGLRDRAVRPSPLVDLPAPLKEGLAWHSILDTFGIPVADLYVGGALDHGFQVVALQDGREYRIDVLGGPYTMETFTRAWAHATAVWNASPWAERDALVEASEARRSRWPEVVVEMGLRGFVSADGNRRRVG